MKINLILSFLFLVFISKSINVNAQRNSMFDKVIIEYSYYILNERKVYIVTPDSIISPTKLYRNDSLNNSLQAIFKTSIDSIKRIYSCYDDGQITKFTFFRKGKQLKISYLAGDKGIPLINIIKIVNMILNKDDKIKILKCMIENFE